MKLTTEIPFRPFSEKLDYTSKTVFSGSCFAANIGEWFEKLKFDTTTNVCGISYNPLSIADHIRYALSGNEIAGSQLLPSNDRYVHPLFHSSHSAKTTSETLDKINGSLKAYAKALRKADYLFLTFGTAIAFEHIPSEKIVNNCHRLPSSSFQKRMLTDAELSDAMEDAILKVISQNEAIKIVLTVSPVRHLRQGAIDNMRSKSRLIRLCENLENRFQACSYLPVYEYVMDELRDYRYYRQDDLIHLNDLGIALIREKVKEAVISETACDLMERIARWNTMRQHIIQDDESAETRKFRDKLEKRDGNAE